MTGYPDPPFAHVNAILATDGVEQVELTEPRKGRHADMPRPAGAATAS